MNVFSKIMRYAYNKIRLRGKCRFKWTTIVSTNSSFEGMNQIFSNTIFHGTMGFGSYIDSKSELYAKIGRFTSIGSGVRCLVGTHPFRAPFVTTCPSFFALNPKKYQNGGTFATKNMFIQSKYIDFENHIAISIGSDCWIGSDVKILGGVHINDGTVVAAGAIVTKDTPPLFGSSRYPGKSDFIQI